MPRVSAKEGMHPRTLSEIVCSLAGAGATSGSRFGGNARIQAFAKSSLQGRGSVCRSQTTDKAAPLAIATIMERRRAVPSRGNGAKLEEVGTSPHAKTFGR